MTINTDEITWPGIPLSLILAFATAGLALYAFGSGNLFAAIITTLAAFYVGTRLAKARGARHYGLWTTVSGDRHPSSINGIRGLRWGLPALVAGAACTVGITATPLREWPVIGNLAPIGVLVVGVLPIIGTDRQCREYLAWVEMRASWISTLATVFSVSEKVVETARFDETDDGGVAITRVPPAIAAKAANRAAVEAALAAVAPHLMLDQTSDASRIVIKQVDAETASRRDGLAATGGALAGQLTPPECRTGQDLPPEIDFGSEGL